MSTRTTAPSGMDPLDRASPWPDRKSRPAKESGVTGRRRSVPHLLLGVVLVLSCAAGFAWVTATSGERVAVLALARPVSIGQVLEAQDLREVTLTVDAEVSAIPVSRVSTVVGQTMATSLPAGSLLSFEVLGTGPVPTRGRAVAALALKEGQFPPEISPGAEVSVVFVSNLSAEVGGSQPSMGDLAEWPATVISVSVPPNGQATIVSVELEEAAAREVAAVPPGQLSVVLLPAGGGR